MKAIVVLSIGFEETEAVAPIDILKRAGVEVDICSITGSDVLTGAHNIVFSADMVLENLLSTDGVKEIADGYDAVILPGGLPNAHNLRDDKRVNDIVEMFYKSGKITAAICASPCTFEKLGMLKNKQATSYPGCIKPESCGKYTQAPAERDGNVITGRSAGAALEFGFEILKGLGMEKEAETVKEQMIVG